MMNEESRGLMPARFMSQIEKINEPPVLSWQKILKKYVGTITANKRKTSASWWQRLGKITYLEVFIPQECILQQ